MSFRAIIETIVQFQSFRNIDLFQQGVYAINFSLYHQMKKLRFPGTPYHFHTEPKPYPQPGALSPAEMDQFLFRSRTFFIKYCDQQIDINDICIFRSEIQLIGDFQDTTLRLVADLMFVQAEYHIVFNTGRDFIPEEHKFQTVSSAQIVIRNPLNGGNSFVPLVFDQQHFCVCNLGVHVMLTDFRFRLQKQLTPIQEQLQALTMATLSDQQQHLPRVLSEFLFGQITEITDEEINRIYQSYVDFYVGTHQRNLRLMQNWSENSVSRRYRSRLPDLPQSMFSIKQEWMKPFTDKIQVNDPQTVAQAMLHNLQYFSAKMYHLQMTFLEFIKIDPKNINLDLQKEYSLNVKQHWGECIFRTYKQVDDLQKATDQNVGNRHKAISRTLRKSKHFISLDPMAIQQKHLFPRPQWHPVLFQDIITTQPTTQDDWNPSWVSYISHKQFRKKAVHLIILVHGFQGNSFDVRMIRNYISLIRPDVSLMCSHQNQGETDGDILRMGNRLAKEIQKYIRDWVPKLEKLSFIGHSLGGVIIRAALPHLKKFSEIMQFYISLSSPHLGYMYNSSTLVDAGMWVLKKWKKNLCLKQLSMTETKYPRQSCMFTLSSAPGLEWFKYVALVSSFQDTYSPFESSRIEVGPRATADPKFGQFYIEMATNLLEKLQKARLYRIDANLKIQGQKLDNFIGRAAHIQMIDDPVLLTMILNCCTHFFEYTANQDKCETQILVEKLQEF